MDEQARADLIERADRITKDQDWGHTEFQLVHFIVGTAGPTTYGLLKQARREIRVRVAAIKPRPVPLWRRVWRWMARGGAAIPPRPKCSPEGRELAILVNLAEALEQRLRRENPDGVKVDQLDAEFCLERILRMALIELFSTGRLTSHSIETILALPQELRASIEQRIPDFAELRCRIESATTSLETLSDTAKTGHQPRYDAPVDLEEAALLVRHT